MVERVDAYVDGKGHLHSSLEKAVLSDLMDVFGKIGGDLTPGLARAVLQGRETVEKAFSDIDRLGGKG